MTQTNNRFLDEIARLMNDATGAAQGVKREVETVVRNQAERISGISIRKARGIRGGEGYGPPRARGERGVKTRIAALEAKLGS